MELNDRNTLTIYQINDEFFRLNSPVKILKISTFSKNFESLKFSHRISSCGIHQKIQNFENFTKRLDFIRIYGRLYVLMIDTK